jgi:hypothetical protein
MTFDSIIVLLNIIIYKLKNLKNMKKLIKPQDVNIEKLEQEVNALTESCGFYIGSGGCLCNSKFYADDDKDEILL